MRKIFGFLLGAVTGGVLGAAAALLLTPSSGNEMRRQINTKIQLLQNEVQDARISKARRAGRSTPGTARSKSLISFRSYFVRLN